MGGIGARTLRNLKIKYKVLLIFVVLLLLIVDLGALNISSVFDIRQDTERIADRLIPRLVETTAIKDNLNSSILAAYDYVQTGEPESKQLYEQYLGDALTAQIQLFYLSSTDADFQFVDSFQDHVNGINSALSDLIATYEAGSTEQAIQAQLEVVSTERDEFAAFLNTEIELKVQEESLQEREATDDRVNWVMINVIGVIVIALVAAIALYSFINSSVTKPVQELTRAANDIGHGRFPLVNIDTRDEMGLFAETFNTMTQRIKATQESLQIELEKTKKLDSQKTEFLSIAAHQLRTPMSGIKWLVNMVAEGDLGPVSEEATEQLTKGKENIDRMITLINSLLDVTQIDTETLQYDFLPHDAVQVVTEVFEELQHAAEEAGVKAAVHAPESETAPIYVDVDKIKMALRNLIDNAIRYTQKDGTVDITLKQLRDTMQIEITDTGYGIPNNEYDRLFTKFYRGTNIQTVQADGSGLGLYVVKQIMDKHDADIEFTSAVGKGTTFTIEIPLATEEAIEKAAKEAAAAKQAMENAKTDVEAATSMNQAATDDQTSEDKTA